MDELFNYKNIKIFTVQLKSSGPKFKDFIKLKIFFATRALNLNKVIIIS